jgi:hypothetical protein
MSLHEKAVDADGYVVKGTVLASKAQLFQLLETWLDASEVPTIGDFGNYGRSAWIKITLDNQRKPC